MTFKEYLNESTTYKATDLDVATNIKAFTKSAVAAGIKVTVETLNGGSGYPTVTLSSSNKPALVKFMKKHGYDESFIE